MACKLSAPGRAITESLDWSGVPTPWPIERLAVLQVHRAESHALSGCADDRDQRLGLTAFALAVTAPHPLVELEAAAIACPHRSNQPEAGSRRKGLALLQKPL